MAIPRAIPKESRSTFNQTTVHRVTDGDTATNTKAAAVDFQSDYGAPSHRWRYRDEYQSSPGRLSISLRYPDTLMHSPQTFTNGDRQQKKYVKGQLYSIWPAHSDRVFSFTMKEKYSPLFQPLGVSACTDPPATASKPR